MQRPCGRSVPSILEKHKEACVAGGDSMWGKNGGDAIRKEVVVRGWCRIQSSTGYGKDKEHGEKFIREEMKQSGLLVLYNKP